MKILFLPSADGDVRATAGREAGATLQVPCPRSRCFETWETTNLLRADSERLAAPQVLLFLFLHGALGVGEDLFRD